MAAIENADGKFRGASLIDADNLEAAIAEASSSAEHGGGHGGPGGHRGPPGGHGPPGEHAGPPGGHRGPPGGGPGGFNPMEVIETQDANKDGKLVGDEIPDHMRQRLDHVDTDGNGEVSREEIEALAERFRHGPPGGPGGRRGPPGGGGPGGGGPGGPPGGHGGGGNSDLPQRPE